MSRRQQSVYCQLFAQYDLYGSHWETCCVSYGTVLHEVITHFFHILLFLWRILPELTKPSSRNLLFLWKIQGLFDFWCMPYTPDNNKPVLQNFSSILCIIFYMIPVMQNIFTKPRQHFFFHDTYINILCLFVQHIWHALTTCCVWETTHDGVTDPCSSTDKNRVYSVDLLWLSKLVFPPLLRFMTERIWRENA